MGVSNEQAAVDPVDAYVRSAAEFGRLLTEVGELQWELPTLCSNWDVRTLVAHVVVSESVLVQMIDGGDTPTVEEISPTVLGLNPVATWRGTVLKAIEAARRPRLAEQPLLHPSGTISGREALGFRTVDNLVHAWDLAQALGVEFEIEEDLAEWGLALYFPLTDVLADRDYWGQMIQPPEEASAGVRLLALLGRQAW